MNKTMRSFAIIIPVVLLAVSSVFQLITTSLRSGIYWVFGWPIYWDLTNEWYQVVGEAKSLYYYWKTGRS